MGVVYRAYDLRLKRTVALKFISPALARDERFRERFARETELAMSLEHPNVVPIHDAGDIDGQLYLAMRLVQSDLRKLLRAETRLEPARAVAICGQVANALDAAHARGLVHRDVKPSNVLLDHHEHVYLADFGLTRRLDENPAAGTDDRSIGTPAYLAPEQLEGTPVDGRADVYALGCVLFECLTSTPPYPRASRLEVAWAHLEEEPPPVSRRRTDLPQAIDHVVSQAMAKDPRARHETCSGLVAAAESALGLRPTAPVRRRTAMLASAVLVVVLAGAGAMAGALASRGGPKAPAPPLFAPANTVARIDPATNKISNVIPVGTSPAAAAVGGQSVWVYNDGDWTISEIDARTDKVLPPVHVHGPSTGCCSPYTGPVLAADPSGAWFISGDRPGRGHLRRLLTGGHGTHTYRLGGVAPTGVAAGGGAVWVVGRTVHDYEVLRIDPATGQVTGRTSFADPIESIAVAFGHVWVVDSRHATLHRIDAQTARPDGQVALHNPPAAQPWPNTYGGQSIYVAYTTPWGSGAWVDASTLTFADNHCGCQPGAQSNQFGAFGSLWYDDWPTGKVYRQWAYGGKTLPITITSNTPFGGGACITALVVGADSTWVAVGPTVDGDTCHTYSPPAN